MTSFAQVLPWIMVGVVIGNYVLHGVHRRWPVGHPWSGLTVLLLAYRMYLQANNLEITNKIADEGMFLVTMISALLWMINAGSRLFKKSE